MPVQVHGPDGNIYQFPDGTDKAAAIAYFRKKGIGVKATAPPTAQPPEARTFGNYASEITHGIGRGLENDLTGIYQAYRHPFKTAEGVANQAGVAGNAARQEFEDTKAAPLHQRLAAGALTFLENAPIIGNAVQHAEEGGGRMASPEAAGAAAEGITTFIAPDVVAKVVGPVARGLKEKVTSARENFGSAPRVVRGLAEKAAETNKGIEKANTEGERQNRTDKALAHHANTEKDLEYHNDLKNKTSEIAEKDATERARLENKHAQEVEDVRVHNRKVMEKHAAVAKRIQEENAAQEHVAQLRQQKEAELQQATDSYRAQEEAVDKVAKAKENEAWSAWRVKMKGATIDGAEIADPLKKLRLDSPEVDRTLNQLEPRGDEVPQESPYARLRDQTAQSNFGGSYDALSPAKQDAVDAMMQRSGESPDPISFNAEDGQPIPVERVQRAGSILQRYIRSGRFEGPLLGEMKQVAKVLRRAVTKASEDHGAGDDLDVARSETVRYNEAFGRERPEPRTVRGEREKSANPEEAKRLQEEDRLEAAAKHDPSLAESQRKVKAAREDLKKLPSEDQLRKSTKQVPAPPSVNHPFEAYRLKEEPAPPQPRLSSGSAEERAAQRVKKPERTPRPGDFIPKEKQTVSSEDIAKAKAKRIDAATNHIRHWGTYLGFVWPAIEVIRGFTRGEMPDLESTAGSMIAVPLAADAIARILESPKMNRLLTRATPKDIANVPEDLRGDLPQIVKAAQKQGITVSPAMAALAGAAGNLHGPKTQQLQRTADAYRSAAQSGQDIPVIQAGTVAE